MVTKPKSREIFAADFRDRIVHHILVGYLEPIWERKFIDQSYACRQGKGAHETIKDLKRYIGRLTKSNTQKAYYLQLDIQSFFVSLKKDILFELVKRHTQSPEILWLTKTIIFHNPTSNYYRKCQLSLFDLIPDHKSLFKVAPDQGLPIGNLTSQFLANIYLNELDQFVKHKLKVKYYLRYVDDFILLSEDKDALKSWRDEIDKFLRDKLKLKLHPQKQILQTIDKGLNFVGFIVKPGYTLMRRRIVKNLKEKLWKINQNSETITPLEAARAQSGSLPLTRFTDQKMKQVLSMVNSYYGQFKHAKTFNLRQKLWHKNFGELQKFLEPVDKDFSYFKIHG